MADQVDEVKQKTDIVSLISEFIDLKKAGRNYRALCPFHSERTPSFMVSSELQIYKCFGCGNAGDAFTFLEMYEGMDFYEALKFLAERASVKLSPVQGGRRSEKQKLYELNAHASQLYHYLLLKHKVGQTALAYLTKERGLKLDTIVKFRLGYSPDNSQVLRNFLVDKKGYQIQEIETAGLAISREKRVIDRFAGRVIFPLFDHRGNVAGFAGRLLPQSEKSDLAKYINSPETPVYHKGNLLYGLNIARGEIKQKNQAVIVEGELDVISSWQAGFRNVVATKGSALTEDQIRLLSRFAKELVLAMDTDLAGNAAARRGVSIAQNEGLSVRVARIKGYKDPDEIARRDPKALKKAIGDSVGAWDFIIDSIFSKHDIDSGEGKAGFSREILPVLVSIADKIVQAHYVEIVARRLKVPSEAVTQQLAKISEARKVEKPEIAIDKKKGRGRRELLEERFLTLIFQSEPDILSKRRDYSLIKTPLNKRIADEYKKYSSKNKKFDPAKFSEALPKELLVGFAEMVLADTQGLTDSPDRLNKEFGVVVGELGELTIKEKLKELGVKIREYEEGGKEEKLEKAKRAFARLTDKLSSLEEQKISGIILHE